jgi:hypothetical protein
MYAKTVAAFSKLSLSKILIIKGESIIRKRKTQIKNADTCPGFTKALSLKKKWRCSKEYRVKKVSRNRVI